MTLAEVPASTGDEFPCGWCNGSEEHRSDCPSWTPSAPTVPDNGGLREARNALAKALGRVLAANGVDDPAVRAGIGVAFLGSPEFAALLAERDELARQVAAVRALRPVWTVAGNEVVPCKNLRRALATVSRTSTTR